MIFEYFFFILKMFQVSRSTLWSRAGTGGRWEMWEDKTAMNNQR